jgi:hypothetical protein
MFDEIPDDELALRPWSFAVIKSLIAAACFRRVSWPLRFDDDLEEEDWGSRAFLLRETRESPFNAIMSKAASSQ